MGNCECVSSKISTVNNDFSGFPNQVTTTLGLKIHFIRIPLSQKDVEKLQNSWINIKQIWIKICATAFQRWFSTYPEIKEMFDYAYENVDETSIKSSPALFAHVQKFECLIEKILNDTENKAKFVETLINLGKFHFELGAQQKFATALGSSLSYATCINISEDDLMTKNAWDTFFRFMTGNVRLGIRMKLMEKTAPT